MNSQNTICAIIGIAVPTRMWMRGRPFPAFGGGTLDGQIVPILAGAEDRDTFNPGVMLRRY